MKTKSMLSLIALAFLFSTCDEDKNEAYPDLKRYLIRFQEEAVKRGYDVDLSSIQAVYVDEIKKQNKPYCGYGYFNYDGNGLKRIEVSKANICGWATLSDLERENLFFHETGHAFLGRPHDEAKRCDGTPVSLMCTTSANQYKIYAAGESDKRDYYIDELLDKMIGVGQCIISQDFASSPTFYANSSRDDTWFFYSSKGAYTGTHSDVLTISASPPSTTNENGYWLRAFNCPNIPECAEVKVRMTLSSTNLTGKGVGIAIRVYDTAIGKNGAIVKQSEFYTTEDKPVSGQLNDVVQELTIPCFTRKTITIYIFGAMLAGTSGDVTFKDIQVLVTPK
jgi:hypothetical protein